MFTVNSFFKKNKHFSLQSAFCLHSLFFFVSFETNAITDHADEARLKSKGRKILLRFACVCIYVCVRALVPAVRSGAAQEGSCSPRPSLTTPETPSAARRRKDCAVDTKHTNTHTEFIMIQTLSHTHTLVVMSQSAVSLSFHKSPDTKR